MYHRPFTRPVHRDHNIKKPPLKPRPREPVPYGCVSWMITKQTSDKKRPPLDKEIMGGSQYVNTRVEAPVTDHLRDSTLGLLKV